MGEVKLQRYVVCSSISKKALPGTSVLHSSTNQFSFHCPSLLGRTLNVRLSANCTWSAASFSIELTPESSLAGPAWSSSSMLSAVTALAVCAHLSVGNRSICARISSSCSSVQLLAVPWAQCVHSAAALHQAASPQCAVGRAHSQGRLCAGREKASGIPIMHAAVPVLLGQWRGSE